MKRLLIGLVIGSLFAVSAKAQQQLPPLPESTVASEIGSLYITILKQRDRIFSLESQVTDLKKQIDVLKQAAGLPKGQ